MKRLWDRSYSAEVWAPCWNRNPTEPHRRCKGRGPSNSWSWRGIAGFHLYSGLYCTLNIEQTTWIPQRKLLLPKGNAAARLELNSTVRLRRGAMFCGLLNQKEQKNMQHYIKGPCISSQNHRPNCWLRWWKRQDSRVGGTGIPNRVKPFFRITWRCL